MKIHADRCRELQDHELIRLSLESLGYFSCLYNRYEADLTRYIRRISGADHEEAQDILQESFIKIWRNLNDFDPDLKVSSWFYRIVHNETVSYIRKKRSFGKDKTVDAALFRDLLPEEQETTADTEAEMQSTIALIDRLPLKYREVLVLKFLEQKSYIEISDILRIPEGTVAIRINRAKKLLRDYLSQ